MKHKENHTMLWLLACQLLWPALELFSMLCGLEFYFRSELAYLILISLGTLWLTVRLHRQEGSPATVFSLLLFPLTIVAGFFQMLLMGTIFAVPLYIANCICAGLLFSKYVPNRWYKYLMTFFCTLLLLAFGFMSFLDLTFGRIGVQIIEQEVHSPDGKKTAQLINDDQGALGGNTFIYIRYQDLIPLGFGGIRKTSVEVHRGPWGQFQDITLGWQDENTLLVNSTPIPIE